MKLGVSGDEGSFSQEAGLIYAKKNGLNVIINYLLDMENVLAAVDNKKIDIGIFPVVNLRGGLVRMAFDAMGHYKFKVIDELWLDVHQCLLVQTDISVKQVKSIVSHSQAIAQCGQYLKKKFSKVKLIEWQDTAKAAKDLSQGKLPLSTAVIAPAHAAHIYGLKILAKNIQDVNPNLTGFIIVKRHD